MVYINRSHFLFIFLNCLSAAIENGPEDSECWWDSDCGGGGDLQNLFIYGCQNRKCKCLHGVHPDENRCKEPNECSGSGDCEGDDAICTNLGCLCKKGIPVIDPHTGKQQSCTAFPACSSNEDCDADRSCRDGVCVCRYGTARAEKSVQVYCKSINYCTSDKSCPFVDGYCNMEKMECACKEGRPMKNDAGYFYRCGPNWAAMLVPIALVCLFVIIMMIVVMVLYMKWRKWKKLEGV